MKIDGSCHCGYITFSGEADPERVMICHCTDCQTGTGSVFRTNIPVPGANFTMLSGEPTIYVKTTAESGNPRAQAFCPKCGTPIYSTWSGSGPCASATSSSRRCRTGAARRSPGSPRSIRFRAT